MGDSAPASSPRSAFWPCFWLAVVLAGSKAVHWSLPGLSYARLADYALDLTVSTHADVLFASGVGVVGQTVLTLTARWPGVQRRVSTSLLAFCVLCVIYAVASVQIFAYLRSPLTYPLLYLAGEMTSMRSSLGHFVSVGLIAAFLGAPLLYLLALGASYRLPSPSRTPRYRAAQALGIVTLLTYVVVGRQAREGTWGDRDDHLIAASPHWELVASSVSELLGGHTPPLTEPYPAEDLLDFEVSGRPVAGARATLPGPPPRNVILVVLESTGTRYLSLYGSPYPTTPTLDAEVGHAVVFDDFYCHVGLTANSLVALSLSIYPYMTWREYTVEYPTMPGQTLAGVLGPRGYRTAFIHSGDLEYVQQDRFLKNRGFDDIMGFADLGSARVSSWGGDDRALVDGVLRWIDRDRGKPFYLTAWTIESHHPYEPASSRPQIDFFRGAVPPDDYDLGRYLNTVRGVDRQLGRLFDGLRERGLADDTLVVITGDHGETFGDPHRTWGHGSKLYQENVNVPFIAWNPRLWPIGGRSRTIGGHVDVNPTVLDLLGVPAPGSWEGRSLFHPARPPRAYFYAANDDYLLGVREESWKYIHNATRGREELFDLSADPNEQRNVSSDHPERCRRLRQRLAAWRAYVGRQLGRVRPPSA